MKFHGHVDLHLVIYCYNIILVKRLIGYLGNKLKNELVTFNFVSCCILGTCYVNCFVLSWYFIYNK